jgi:hypothetical protein
MMAKLVTAVVVAAAALLASVAIALVVAAGQRLTGGTVDWHMPIDELAALGVYNVLAVLLGFGLGSLTRNVPASLVGLFVVLSILPGGLGLLGSTWSWGEQVNRWLNYADLTAALRIGAFDEVRWPELAVAVAVWIVAPILVGFRRIETAEIK